MIPNHLHCVGKKIYFYFLKQGSFIVLGDISKAICNTFLEQLSVSFKLESLVEESTCFKYVDNIRIR